MRLERSHVKPKFADRAVFCEQFTHLSLVELMVLRSHEIGIVAGNRICMRIVPVNQGKIQAELQAVLCASLGELADKVPSARHHLHAAVFRCPGIEHAESVMVL